MRLLVLVLLLALTGCPSPAADLRLSTVGSFKAATEQQASDSLIVVGQWQASPATFDSLIARVASPFPPLAVVRLVASGTGVWPTTIRAAFAVPEGVEGLGYQVDVCVTTFRGRNTPGNACSKTNLVEVPVGQVPPVTGLTATMVYKPSSP